MGQTNSSRDLDQSFLRKFLLLCRPILSLISRPSRNNSICEKSNFGLLLISEGVFPPFSIQMALKLGVERWWFWSVERIATLTIEIIKFKTLKFQL